MPRLLAIKEPRELPQALALCQKLENQTFRTNYAQNSRPNIKKFVQSPQLPPRYNKPTTNYPQFSYQLTSPYQPWFDIRSQTFQTRNGQFQSYSFSKHQSRNGQFQPNPFQNNQSRNNQFQIN